MIRKAAIPFSITLLFILPFLFLFIQVKGSDIQSFISILFSEITTNTYFLIVLSSLFSILWALPSAYFQSKYTFKYVKFLNWTMMLPLALPAYIAAYTYKGMLGPFGTTHNFFNFYLNIESIFYLSLIFSFVLYPYLFIILKNHFRYQNPHLIEAAQSLGSSKFQSFFRIRFPLLIPAIISGITIIAMEILNNFGAVSYFGISTYTTEIIQKWSPIHKTESIGISLALLVSVCIIFGFDYFYKRKKHFIEHGLQFEKPKQVAKGNIYLFGIISQVLPFIFGFLIPTIQLCLWAITEYEHVIDSDFLSLILNTMQLAIKAIFFCILIALIFAFFIRLYPSKALSFLTKLSTVGYAFPGVVVSIAVLEFAKFLEIIHIDFTAHLGTFLIFAYLIRFQAISLNGIKASLEKIPFHFHEASNSLGKNKWDSLYKIEWPLIKSAIYSSILMIFVDVSKELPLTMMFQSFNFETLAIRSYLLMITDGAIYQSAVPSLCIVCIGILPALFLNKLSK